MKTHEIQISRKTTRNTLFALILLLVVAGGFFLLRSDPSVVGMITRFHSTETPTMGDPATMLDAQAAVSAITAFYTLDHTVPEAQWQGSVCKWTTTDGCTLIQQLYALPVRALVDANQVQTGCTVKAVRLVENNSKSRTWLLTVSLDHPWPGAGAEFPVYAQVTQQNGTWLLEHILLEQEAARFQITSDATATPAH